MADDGFYCLQPWIQAEFVLEIIRGSELMLIGNFLNLTSNIQPNPKLVWVTVSKSRCYLHGIIRFAEHLKILINLILMPKPETVLLAENMTMFHVHSRNTTKWSIPVRQKLSCKTSKVTCLNLIFNNGLPCIHLLCHLWVLACSKQTTGDNI